MGKASELPSSLIENYESDTEFLKKVHHVLLEVCYVGLMLLIYCQCDNALSLQSMLKFVMDNVILVGRGGRRDWIVLLYSVLEVPNTLFIQVDEMIERKRRMDGEMDGECGSGEDSNGCPLRFD